MSNEQEDTVTISRLRKDLAAATEQLEEANAEIEELEEQGAQPDSALEALFRTVHGRRLITRAYLANPKATASELSYLGADSIRGELEVDAQLAKALEHAESGPG